MYVLGQQVAGLPKKDMSWRLVIFFKKYSSTPSEGSKLNFLKTAPLQCKCIFF